MLLATTTRLFRLVTMRLQSSIALDNDNDKNDDEYEYIEYDALTEAEFLQSEWLIGTNFDRQPDQIIETCRLIVNEAGKNIAVWGDGAQGTWNLDVASQFLSISKESVWKVKDIGGSPSTIITTCRELCGVGPT